MGGVNVRRRADGRGGGWAKGHNKSSHSNENTMGTQDGMGYQSYVHEITQNSQNSRTTSATGVESGETEIHDEEIQERTH